MKVYNPDLIRILQAYPADIRGLGLLNNPDLIRILQAYPAYIRGLGLISNIPAQIGDYRLILPILGA